MFWHWTIYGLKRSAVFIYREFAEIKHLFKPLIFLHFNIGYVINFNGIMIRYTKHNVLTLICSDLACVFMEMYKSSGKEFQLLQKFEYLLHADSN